MSATDVASKDFGTSVHALKDVFQVARPAVCPLISSDKVNVSEAGISPVTILDAPFCAMSSTLPRLPERTVATLPTKSVGTRTSIASVGSSTAVPAVSNAPHTCPS